MRLPYPFWDYVHNCLEEIESVSKQISWAYTFILYLFKIVLLIKCDASKWHFGCFQNGAPFSLYSRVQKLCRISIVSKHLKRYQKILRNFTLYLHWLKSCSLKTHDTFLTSRRSPIKTWKAYWCEFYLEERIRRVNWSYATFSVLQAAYGSWN